MLRLGFMAADPSQAGRLATQGSKDAFPIYRGSKKDGTRTFTGKVALVDNDKKLGTWRATVAEAARAAILASPDPKIFPLVGPVRVDLVFSIKAPKKIPADRCGWPTTKPDGDKLVRAIFDALTEAGVWCDDSQPVIHRATKAYDVLPVPGALVRVYSLTEEALDVVKALADCPEVRTFLDRLNP